VEDWELGVGGKRSFDRGGEKFRELGEEGKVGGRLLEGGEV